MRCRGRSRCERRLERALATGEKAARLRTSRYGEEPPIRRRPSTTSPYCYNLGPGVRIAAALEVTNMVLCSRPRDARACGRAAPSLSRGSMAELLKLGIAIGQTGVAKYMARRRGPPSQGWRTFLRNHADGIAAIDLFVVPTISFRLLYGLLILRHDRRRLLWLGATTHPTAE